MWDPGSRPKDALKEKRPLCLENGLEEKAIRIFIHRLLLELYLHGHYHYAYRDYLQCSKKEEILQSKMSSFSIIFSSIFMSVAAIIVYLKNEANTKSI